MYRNERRDAWRVVPQALDAALADGGALYEAAVASHDVVTSHTSPAGRDRLRQEMAVARDESDDCRRAVADVTVALAGDVAAVDSYVGERARFVAWLEAAEREAAGQTPDTALGDNQYEVRTHCREDGNRARPPTAEDM